MRFPFRSDALSASVRCRTASRRSAASFSVIPVELNSCSGMHWALRSRRRPAGVSVTSTRRSSVARSLAADEPVGLQPFQQRRKRSRVELQSLAQSSDGDAALLPQHQQHQVLRVGEVQLGQDRPVRRRHRPRRRIQGEAEVTVETHRGHARTIVHNLIVHN